MVSFFGWFSGGVGYVDLVGGGGWKNLRLLGYRDWEGGVVRWVWNIIRVSFLLRVCRKFERVKVVDVFGFFVEKFGDCVVGKGV